MISRLIRTLVGILAVIAMLVIAFYAALYLWNRHIEASMRQRDGAERSDDMVASQMMGYVTRGRYDDAVRTGLEALRNEPRDAAIYQQLAMVYMSRARKEQGQREQWIREAVAYVGKAVSVDSNDPVNVLEAAHALAAAGGLSSEKRCPYYQRASELSEQMEPLYSVAVQLKTLIAEGMATRKLSAEKIKPA